MRALIDFLLLLHGRFRDDRCLQVAGALTFTTLLALVPLVTIALTVFSAFPVFAGFSDSIRSFVLANLVPASSARVIGVYMQQFADNAGRLTALGIGLLMLTAFMTMRTIDRTFDTIWRVRRPRPLVRRLLTYWAVLSIGPLLIGASLSLTSWLLSWSFGLAGGIGLSRALLLRFVAFALTTAAFALLYRTVPNHAVAPRDAVLGGALAGALFEAMKSAFGHYVTQFPTYKLVYGAFASVPLFLLWIYLCWIITILGAVVTANLPYLRSGGVRRKKAPGNQFIDALHLLRLLYQAHASGAVPRLEALRAALRLSREDCEALLERLLAAGWIARTLGDGWVLARDAGEIRVAEVYRRFVIRPEKLGAENDPALDALMHTLAARIDEVLSMSLKGLFALQEEKPAARRIQAV